MKITVYTVSDCQFSKAEKEYLKQHHLPYDEKNLEENREWLTEMLAISNNFAGTPVTKIEKDDGSIVVLKGFTQEEFDKELGLSQPQTVTQANAQINPPPPVSSTSSNSSSSAPSQSSSTTQPPSPPSVQPVSTNQSSASNPTAPLPPSQPQTAPTIDQPTTNPPNDLSNILQNLQEKFESPPINQNQPPPPTDLPNIPDFKDQQ